MRRGRPPDPVSSDGTPVVVVLVTGPDRATLEGIGRRMVEERLAACCNTLGSIRSVYRWKGTVEEEGEALAILKTTKPCVGRLERAVLALHPYDEPEFLVLPVLGGSRTYLEWVIDNVYADPGE